jgi:predicted SAM-dependent methyltransferase
MDLPVAAPLRLNLGSGGRVIEGYTNVDLAGEPDVRADVRDLPFEDETVDEAMAIHVLEHLARWDAPAALAEWFRVLKPGGKLVLELPDLVKCCQNVIAGMGERMGLWGLYGDPSYRVDLMSHRWGWSAEELIVELRAVGFRRVKVREPQFHKKGRDMRLEATK